MKKILYFAAIAAALASCSKAEVNEANAFADDEPFETEPATISIGFADNDEVKTYCNANGVVRWVKADTMITVFDSYDNNCTFKSDNQTSAPTKTFAGKIQKGSSIKFVVFPKSTAMSCSNETVSNVLILSKQAPNNADSFDQKSNIAISKSDSTLKNVCAYLRFVEPDDHVFKSVTVKTLTAGEYLTGRGDIDFSGDTPEFTFTAGVDSVIVTPKANTANLICIAPGTYHGIAIITDDGEKKDTVKYTGTQTFKRNQRYSIGALGTQSFSVTASFKSGTIEKADLTATGISDFLSANLSVDRECTTAGGSYAKGDIVKTTKITKDTVYTISNGGYNYDIWAGVGINKNTSSSVITSLGFNDYKENWTYKISPQDPDGKAKWTCGEKEGGYAWIKFPAIDSCTLTKVSVTLGSKTATMNIYAGVNSDGSGTTSKSNEIKITSNNTGVFTLTDPEAKTSYYLSINKNTNIPIASFVLTYVKKRY